MNHPTWQELFEHDGPGPGSAARIASHLASCDACRAAWRAARDVDGALRRLPPERPSASFDRALLRRLGLREATPLLWVFLRNFAPILVAGIVAVAVIGLGGSGTSEPSAGRSLFDTELVWETSRGAVGAFVSWAGSLSAKWLALPVGQDSVNLTLFLACFFAAIGLLDRFLLQPIIRRRHQAGAR